jgi:predicted HicB family RNase H-like nuclease
MSYKLQKGGDKLKTVTLRLPNSTHRELLAEAKKEGISLNQLCLAKLSKPLEYYAELGEKTLEGKE